LVYYRLPLPIAGANELGKHGEELLDALSGEESHPAPGHCFVLARRRSGGARAPDQLLGLIGSHQLGTW
jgi:hypothetical protein